MTMREFILEFHGHMAILGNNRRGAVVCPWRLTGLSTVMLSGALVMYGLMWFLSKITGE